MDPRLDWAWDSARDCFSTMFYNLLCKDVCFAFVFFFPFDICNLPLFLQALDTFSAAIVSPVYYVMFTTLTVVASAIMFKVWLTFPMHPHSYVFFFLLPDLSCIIFNTLPSNCNFWCCYILQDWSGQTASSIASELCGFITVLSGTIILHATREQEPILPRGSKNIIELCGFDS